MNANGSRAEKETILALPENYPHFEGVPSLSQVERGSVSNAGQGQGQRAARQAPGVQEDPGSRLGCAELGWAALPGQWIPWGHLLGLCHVQRELNLLLGVFMSQIRSQIETESISCSL